MENVRRRLVNTGDIAGLLLGGWDPFWVRAAIAFRNRRGERRVSWLAHRAELDVVRERAGRLGTSMGAQVREWWLDGLPLLVEGQAVSGDPGGWTVYAHHLPRFLPRSPGTPRGEWVGWRLPHAVLDLEEQASGGQPHRAV